MDGAAAARCSHERRAAYDVATGSPVIWIESNAGHPAEQLRWSLRCSRFAALHHRHIARLVDFGLLGKRRRFEAWRGEPAPRDATTRAAARALMTYLLGHGLTTHALPVVIGDRGRLVVLPDARAGGDAHACAPPSGHAPPLGACGLETIVRPAVTAIAELLADPGRRAPVAVALWGEVGSGLGVAARVLARVARLNGLVPIDAALADSRVWEAIGDRSLLLLDRSGDGQGWRRLIDRVGRRSRPHVLLLLARQPVPRVHNLQLEAVTPGDLVAAVRPHTGLSDSRRVIERAAGRAAGRPARFAALLWPPSALTGPATRPAASLAAERAPEYGEGELPASRPALPQRTWPIAGDIVALRQKLTRALTMVEHGRHAMGIREARGAVAALARRREWSSAIEGASALAVALTRRGQVGDAQRWLEHAQTWAEALGEPQGQGTLTLAAIALHVHRGAWADAEGAARGLLAAANVRGDLAQVVAASAGLAEALFWQGRYADAADAVEPLRQRGTRTAGETSLAIAAARAAIGLRRPTAIGLAAEAIALSERSGSPRQRAEAYGVSALASLVAGDSAGARRAAAAAIGAARTAHDPLLALDSRLLDAEALRRVGRTALAARTIARVARLSRAAQPAPVAARVALLRELLTGAAPQAAADALAARSGLPALALFVPLGDGAGSSAPPIEDLLGLIAMLQAADDEVAVLTATCVRLREALRAAAAGFVVPQGTSFRLLATDGGRLDITTGGRACSAGQRITIVPTAGGLESGLPVNCGGRTVGALALRWNPGGTPCPDRVAAWMTVASALAAPSLAAAVRGSGSATAEEIVGDSDGMVAVRRAVDRAAPAPFPVLIEGESGSGKELVARALHRRSPRRDRSFVALNCAAIPDDLLEAELFGHARGAFTGALIERPGVFEEAHGGTLFLDEVGELSPRAQAKLLRVLQEGEVRRIGENVPRRVDVRVVAATNRDLRAEVAAARFRIDLMYRLDVVRIAVPPLRERITDLPVLVDRFWRQATDRVQSRAVLSSATLATLARHTWPGNVRELQNVLASLAVRAPRRGVVMPSALPWSGEAAVDSPLRLDLARREFEIRFVRAALVRNGGHRARAACELGLSRQGLTKLMARLGVADGVVPPGGCREPGR